MSNKHADVWRALADHPKVSMHFRMLAAKYYSKAVKDLDYYKALTEAEIVELETLHTYWKENHALLT